MRLFDRNSMCGESTTPTCGGTCPGVEACFNDTIACKCIISITVTPVDPNINNGGTQQFIATATFSDSTTADVTDSVTWSSNNPPVATISNTGLATGAYSGIATITATLGVSSSTFLVVGTISSIAVTPADATIAISATQQYTATATFADATTADITSVVDWTSSNPIIATIDTAGLATGENNGQTTIGATYNSVSGSTLLDVGTVVCTDAFEPTCNGTCPIGQECLAGGGGCGCVLPCVDTTTPTCGGFCAVGQTCEQGLSGCECVAGPLCGGTAPACGGDCPVGESCGVSAGECVCLSGTLTCGESPTPTCGGTCPGVEACFNDTIACKCIISITVTPVDPNINNGGTQQFIATATFSDSTTADVTDSVTWSSNNPPVATISNTGLATGAYSGIATITATLGVSSSTFLVVGTISSIAVTPADATIAISATQQYTATATFADATTADITSVVDWTSSNPIIATIDTAGLATGENNGQTTIGATYNSVSGSTLLDVGTVVCTDAFEPTCNGTCPIGQECLAGGGGCGCVLPCVDTTTPTCGGFCAVGQTCEQGLSGCECVAGPLCGGTAPACGGDCPVGESCGVSAGECVCLSGTLTCGESPTPTCGGTCAGGEACVNDTTACKCLASIQVTPVDANIPDDSFLQYTATGTFDDSTTANITDLVNWSSSNPSICTISAAGLAACVALGITQITATLGSASDSTYVAVGPIISIAVTPADANIASNGTQQYTATATFQGGAQQNITDIVVWSSSAPGVATISNAPGTIGLATAGSGTGVTTITATFGSISGSTFLVVGTVSSFAVTPAVAYIPSSSTQQYTATLTFADSSTADITDDTTWSSSATSVATISNAPGTQGLATGTSGSGFTTITGTFAVFSETAALVVGTVTSIAVTPANPTINVGGTQQFTATATFSDSSTADITPAAEWASGTTSVATISNAPGSTGLATGLQTGTSTISATLGATGSTLLTISNVQSAGHYGLTTAPNNFVFIMNAGNVERCLIDGSNNLTQCVNLGITGGTNIAFNSSYTFAYIVGMSNAGGHAEVLLCDYASATGTLSNCGSAGITGTSAIFFYVAVNPTGTFVYIDGLMSCPADPVTGMLSPCSPALSGPYPAPHAFGFNFTNNVVYYNDNTQIYQCTSIDPVTGVITNCSFGGTVIDETQVYYAITPAATFLYLSGQGDPIPSSVEVCNVNAITGLLSNCVDSGAPMAVGNPRSGMGFNSAGTVIYMNEQTFSSPATTTKCTVNVSTGQLSGCVSQPTIN